MRSPEALQVLANLASTYSASQAAFERSSGSYQESEARSEFIDPLLEAFGWDVNNKAGLIHSARDVLREESQRAENSTAKKPDYTLRIRSQRKVFVEAKKPSVDILTSKESVQQARSYGYTAGHPIVILTNFRNLAIYDTSQPPREADPPEAFRLFLCDFNEYGSKFDEIYELIGREMVSEPNWLEDIGASRSTRAIPADETLLAQISNWKLEIAEDVLSSYPDLTSAHVDELAQKLINRLLFIRMCEDRGIEGEAFLKSSCSSKNFDVKTFFEKLNQRYNSGLFDSSHGPAEPTIYISANLVSRFVETLYAPYSPFSFSVLGAELLGMVYENSLTEHLIVSNESGNLSITLEKKREYLRRDVVATPQQLVESTVRDGINCILDKSISDVKVLDFAIGSGRFLLSAYNQAVEKIVDERLAKKQHGDLVKIGLDSWKLSFHEKCQLLKKNYFGIDVDYSAVEVAKFSLLVNLLEDESLGTLPTSGRILPNLDSNILHGNTLVSVLQKASETDMERTVPLDWTHTNLPGEFDLIVGNPPYMKTEDIKALNPIELEYLKANYKFAFKQFDKYMPFIEVSLSKVSKFGAIAVVIPNKWMTIVAGQVMRDELKKNNLVRKLANFRSIRVFEEKDTYVCSLIISNGSNERFTYVEPISFDSYLQGSDVALEILESDFRVFGSDSWILPSSETERKVLKALATNSVPLGQLLEPKNGIQTSKDKLFVIKESEIVSITDDLITFTKNGKTWSIELEVTKPFLDDSRNVRSYEALHSSSRIIYPYQPSDASANTSGFEPIPEAVLKVDFPLTFEYFLQNAGQLATRDMAETNDSIPFYVFGRTQSIGSAPKFPKIMYSVNQRGDKYALDESGIVYASGGTAGNVGLYPKSDQYSLDFFLALLAQTPIEFFNRKSGSPFQGGYFARGTAVIQEVPVPVLDFSKKTDCEFHKFVSDSNKQIRDLTSRSKTAQSKDLAVINHAIAQLKEKVSQTFNERWGLVPGDLHELLGSS